MLALTILAVYAATVAILLRMMPGPHKAMDYLVIGAAATCVSMLILFLALVKRSDAFYKRRKPSG
jgi:hypothetical protein